MKLKTQTHPNVAEGQQTLSHESEANYCKTVEVSKHYHQDPKSIIAKL